MPQIQLPQWDESVCVPFGTPVARACEMPVFTYAFAAGSELRSISEMELDEV